jgi:hypothetical protein
VLNVDKSPRQSLILKSRKNLEYLSRQPRHECAENDYKSEY